MKEANKVKLGAFIFITVTLIVLCFFAVGIGKAFQPKMAAMTVINSSVEGLTVGSPVKYMGVQIGRVTRISMRDTDGYVDAYFDIFTSVMDVVSEEHAISQSSPENFDKSFSMRNMCCFLNASGIMGGSFIELSNDRKNLSLPDLKVKPPLGVFYIPSRNSHVTNLIQNIGDTLEQLTQIKMVELSQDLRKTLDAVNKAIDNPELGQIITRFNRVSSDLEACSTNLKMALTEERVKKLLNTIDYLEKGSRNFSEAMPKERIEKITKDFTETANELKKFLKNADITREDISGDAVEVKQNLLITMNKLNKTLEEITAFINSLDNDPSQLIRGKQEKPIFKQKPLEIK